MDIRRGNLGELPLDEIIATPDKYSCDIPAQSLAYKLGEVKIMSIRDDMQARLGGSFDIRDFHQSVLQDGALPLSIVEQNVHSRAIELSELSA